jgi:hypothetical protein
MMVRSDPHHSVNGGESLYDLVARCAAAARPVSLAGIALVCGAAAAAVLRLNIDAWPLAMFFLTTFATCLWGILEQLPPIRPRWLIKSLQIVLAVVGSAAAAAGATGVLFWIMGPAPVL